MVRRVRLGGGAGRGVLQPGVFVFSAYLERACVDLGVERTEVSSLTLLSDVYIYSVAREFESQKAIWCVYGVR